MRISVVHMKCTSVNLAVKEWDKGMLLAYTQMKGINSEESSTGRSGYRALSGKRNYVAAR